MPEFVSAYSDDETNTVVTVTAEFAENQGLTVLKNEPALGRNGDPLPPRDGNRTTKTSATPVEDKSGGQSASKPEEGSK